MLGCKVYEIIELLCVKRRKQQFEQRCVLEGVYKKPRLHLHVFVIFSAVPNACSQQRTRCFAAVQTACSQQAECFVTAVNPTPKMKFSFLLFPSEVK